MKKYSQISNKEKVDLLQEFCEAISVLSNPEEIMDFITDLLTKQETIMIARRIKIAKMLINGNNYQEIRNSLKVGLGTIAKINQWLLELGQGFRIIAQRTKKEKSKKTKLELSEFQKFKKRYPIMFWPQLLMEEIIKTMNVKQKDRIRRSLRDLDRKSQVYKQVNNALTQK